MHKSRALRLNALSRVRLLAEQRAEIAVEQASSALHKAGDELQLANHRVEQVAVWKADLTRSDSAWVGMYEQGVLSEQYLVMAVEKSADVSRRAEAEHRDQTASLLQASRSVKVVERRSEHAQRLEADRRERSLADAAADMWLSRRMHADR